MPPSHQQRMYRERLLLMGCVYQAEHDAMDAVHKAEQGKEAPVLTHQPDAPELLIAAASSTLVTDQGRPSTAQVRFLKCIWAPQSCV